MDADDPKSIGDSRGPYNKLRHTCFANLIFFCFSHITCGHACELEGWSDKARLASMRHYMLGYYGMDGPSIKGRYQLAARFSDDIFKLYINRF